MSDPVLVIGAGAMGCLFSSMLAASGQEVVVLARRKESVEALRNRGVTLIDGDRAPISYPVRATGEPLECRGTPIALVLVKGWQTEWAAAELAGILPPGGLALTLQNGLGNFEILSNHLGAGRTAVGSTTWGAVLESPGIVRLHGRGSLIIGRRAGLSPLTNILSRAGFEPQLTDEIDLILWRKLVINAAINPVTALLNINNGELLSNPNATVLTHHLTVEASLVGQAQGYPLPLQEMLNTVEQTAHQTSSNLSSMLQDFRRGAPTEIDTITGIVIQRGKEFGVETPYSQAVYLLVKAAVHARETAQAGFPQ